MKKRNNGEDFDINEVLIKHILEKSDIPDIIKVRKVIPLAIFQVKALSILEAIVKYLKENGKYKYSQIARLLNRDQRTIWTTYKNAKDKFSGKINTKFSEFDIPVEVFSKKKHSALESMTLHLRKTYDLGFTDIGRLIGRDPKTIWTSNSRAKKK